jgi:hypothetical protein
MEPRIIRSDDFYKRRILQLEGELRRSELARKYAEDDLGTTARGTAA